MIDAIQSDTGKQEVKYSGRSWHGILNSKIIEPDAGEAYLVVSGEANSVIGGLIARLGLSDLFSASSEDSGLTITSYQMNRYIAAYDGIRKMLKTVNGRLRFSFEGGKVVLSAHARGAYTDDNELDSDVLPFKAKRYFNPVNHLICLGRGELAEREVLHLYLNASGEIGTEQTFFGLSERTTTWDYPNAESREELQMKGIEQFEKLRTADTLEMNLSEDDDRFEVQDVIGGTDHVTGLSAVSEVTKKIVTIENGQITISYKC